MPFNIDNKHNNLYMVRNKREAVKEFKNSHYPEERQGDQRQNFSF